MSTEVGLSYHRLTTVSVTYPPFSYDSYLMYIRALRVTFKRQTSYSLSAHGLPIDNSKKPTKRVRVVRHSAVAAKKDITPVLI